MKSGSQFKTSSKNLSLDEFTTGSAEVIQKYICGMFNVSFAHTVSNVAATFLCY